ncbi:MAG: phosphoglucosamine mutase [bacterium]
MKPFKISASGVRGVIGGALTPDLLIRFAQSFGTYLESGRVVVGRDTRPTGPMLHYAVLAGLISTGCEIIDLGICPTPSIQLMVEHLGADGGISITAGHNDASWNALELIREDGIHLNPFQGQEVLDIYHQGEFIRAPWNRLGKVREESGAVDLHIHKILEGIGGEAIRERRFKVAIDPCNGTGGLVDRSLLEALGCEVVAINDEPRGFPPHDPELIPRNLLQLSSLVRASGADVGFAQDLDADRLAIVDETGRPAGEENTLALLCEYTLRKHPGANIVTNLSTTRAIEDIAGRYGGSALRTKVGKEYIAEYTKNFGAALGGEGSGGIVVPQVHYAEDSFAAIPLMLQFMAETGAKVSELVSSLPKYTMIKEKVPCPPERIYRILSEIREMYSEENVDMTDGVKVDFGDSWLHVRASNTEPIIRVIVESKDEGRAETLCRRTLKQIHFLLTE